MYLLLSEAVALGIEPKSLPARSAMRIAMVKQFVFGLDSLRAANPRSRD